MVRAEEIPMATNLLGSTSLRCTTHRDAAATLRCDQCGRPFCRECLTSRWITRRSSIWLLPVVRARIERLAGLGHDVGLGLADDRHRRVADPLLVAAGRRRGAGLAVERPLAADPALGPDHERDGAG
jgi:hypothetical protein